MELFPKKEKCVSHLGFLAYMAPPHGSELGPWGPTFGVVGPSPAVGHL
jgi:hypothetical protein